MPRILDNFDENVEISKKSSFRYQEHENYPKKSLLFRLGEIKWERQGFDEKKFDLLEKKFSNMRLSFFMDDK